MCYLNALSLDLVFGAKTCVQNILILFQSLVCSTSGRLQHWPWKRPKSSHREIVLAMHTHVRDWMCTAIDMFHKHTTMCLINIWKHVYELCACKGTWNHMYWLLPYIVYNITLYVFNRTQWTNMYAQTQVLPWCRCGHTCANTKKVGKRVCIMQFMTKAHEKNV